MKPVQLDEYPIHQSPLSLGRVSSTDRNFYDRNYFNAHDRTGDVPRDITASRQEVVGVVIERVGLPHHRSIVDPFVWQQSSVDRNGRLRELCCTPAERGHCGSTIAAQRFTDVVLGRLR